MVGIQPPGLSFLRRVIATCIGDIHKSSKTLIDLRAESQDIPRLEPASRPTEGPMNEKERDKLLFWFVQAGMWGRFSGSTESFIDQDLAALESADGGLDKLLEQLRLWHGGLRAEPGHFTGWSLGARFYPVLYFLTRMGEARDCWRHSGFPPTRRYGK